MTHQFGGNWTTEKLEIVAQYLNAYTKALKNQPTSEHPFIKGYIDAFAGTGYREHAQGGDRDESDPLPFADLAGPEPQGLLDGSARLALRTEPRFDRYVFIERRADRCTQLEALKTEFPHLASDITVRQGDANSVIRELCARNWSSRRAVLFLDPYGMQVEWETIQAVAKTKAIDLWVLWPLGVGVNRLLTRSGAIPATWRSALDRLLGTSDWFDELYRVEKRTDLFGDETTHFVKATTDTIGRYFNDRLRSVFAGVAEHPRVLLNSTRCPLYLLCFAAGNQKGARVALRIAEHLLQKTTE